MYIAPVQSTNTAPNRRHRPLAFVRRVAYAFVVGALAALPATAHAQGLLSAGFGLGGGVGDRNRNTGGNGAHALGFVQLHPPLLPVALRVDGLVSKADVGGTGAALLGNAVFIAPVPVVQPYAVLGYGRYGIGKSDGVSGWNAGVGARVRIPAFSIFVEARHHQRVGRDLLTIGIVR